MHIPNHFDVANTGINCCSRIRVKFVKRTAAALGYTFVYVCQYPRCAEGLLSDAIAQKTKAERAKVLLNARLTAVRVAERKHSETPSASGGQAQSSQDSDSSESNRGCPLRGGFGAGTTAVPMRKETQRGSTAGVDARGTRHAANGKEREGLPDAAKSSLLSGSSAQQQQQQRQQPREQEHEKRVDLEPATKDSARAGRQRGQRLDGRPGWSRDHAEMGQQGSSREGGRQAHEPEEQQQLKDALEGEKEEEPELERKVERERRKFDAERQRLERERRESSEAAQHAEARVREVEAAWQALAEKVMTLAERNADLEWVRR